MSETKGKYRFKIVIETGYANAQHVDYVTVEDLGYTREKWDSLSEVKRDENLNNWSTDFMNNHVEFYWTAEDE